MRKFEPIFLRKSRILSGFSCEEAGKREARADKPAIAEGVKSSALDGTVAAEGISRSETEGVRGIGMSCNASGRPERDRFPLFRVDESVMLPEFLNIVIQSPQFIKICQLTSIGTSNRRRVKLGKFLESRIPLPSIAEQKKFLETIENMNTEIGLYQKKAEELRERVDLQIENILSS